MRRRRRQTRRRRHVVARVEGRLRSAHSIRLRMVDLNGRVVNFTTRTRECTRWVFSENLLGCRSLPLNSVIRVLLSLLVAFHFASVPFRRIVIAISECRICEIGAATPGQRRLKTARIASGNLY